MKIFHIEVFLHFSPYLVRMRENTDQKNSEYGHSSRRGQLWWGSHNKKSHGQWLFKVYDEKKGSFLSFFFSKLVKNEAKSVIIHIGFVNVAGDYELNFKCKHCKRGPKQYFSSICSVAGALDISYKNTIHLERSGSCCRMGGKTSTSLGEWQYEEGW